MLALHAGFARMARRERAPRAGHGPLRADTRRARRVEHVPGVLRVQPRAGGIQPRGGAPQPVRRDAPRHRESAPARAGQQRRLGDPGGPGGLRRRDVRCPGRPERREGPASRAIARKMRGTRPVGSAPPTRPPLATERNGAPSSVPLRARHAATGFTLSGPARRSRLRNPFARLGARSRAGTLRRAREMGRSPATRERLRLGVVAGGVSP